MLNLLKQNLLALITAGMFLV